MEREGGGEKTSNKETMKRRAEEKRQLMMVMMIAFDSSRSPSLAFHHGFSGYDINRWLACDVYDANTLRVKLGTVCEIISSRVCAHKTGILGKTRIFF